MQKKIYDADDVQVVSDCEVSFSYGIPPVMVIAPVIKRDGELIIITKGHNPEESRACDLEESVGYLYIRKTGLYRVLENGKHVRRQTRVINERKDQMTKGSSKGSKPSSKPAPAPMPKPAGGKGGRGGKGGKC
jgi:hypothetical protein